MCDPKIREQMDETEKHLRSEVSYLFAELVREHDRNAENTMRLSLAIREIMTSFLLIEAVPADKEAKHELELALFDVAKGISDWK